MWGVTCERSILQAFYVIVWYLWTQSLSAGSTLLEGSGWPRSLVYFNFLCLLFSLKTSCCGSELVNPMPKKQCPSIPLMLLSLSLLDRYFWEDLQLRRILCAYNSHVKLEDTWNTTLDRFRLWPVWLIRYWQPRNFQIVHVFNKILYRSH
jgi:hypothetical protein